MTSDFPLLAMSLFIQLEAMKKEEMEISEIYEKFDKIGCLTFATINGDMPETRIAHLFAYDDEGLYFRVTITKAFYNQLVKTEKVSICGMYPDTTASHNDDGMPYFKPGYAIRASGDTKEISLGELKRKAERNDLFMLGVKDIEIYPAITTICLYSAYGEIYDFDYEIEHRDHKLLRIPFSFGGRTRPFNGLRINADCNACGDCEEKCSFKAITHDEANDKYVIDSARCEVCGDCYMVCENEAIEIVLNEE